MKKCIALGIFMYVIFGSNAYAAKINAAECSFIVYSQIRNWLDVCPEGERHKELKQTLDDSLSKIGKHIDANSPPKTKDELGKKIKEGKDKMLEASEDQRLQECKSGTIGMMIKAMASAKHDAFLEGVDRNLANPNTPHPCK